ncbi:uncharacterized protein LOC143174681 [Nomia melanderi]|uniref:uncharacterized protein LOC143174681 n=1 Tax=Nomia melanderi TaxID=2448451 RepID=UPI003FCC5DDF
MCAANSPCRSPPRTGSSTEDHHGDNARFHQQHPPYHPPYIYYPPPPPYPPLNPYGPYGPYHSGAFYSSAYCNDAVQEPKGSSWIGIIFMVFLILCVAGIICYRSLSRESRRRLNARLPILTQPTQGR